jgi:hypothetical protein
VAHRCQRTDVNTLVPQPYDESSRSATAVAEHTSHGGGRSAPVIYREHANGSTAFHVGAYVTAESAIKIDRDPGFREESDHRSGAGRHQVHAAALIEEVSTKKRLGGLPILSAALVEQFPLCAG